MIQDVNCKLVSLPATIKSYVVQNSDMSYTILLNNRLTHEQNMLCYAHEMSHIINHDFDKNADINEIERNAHMA